MTHRTTGRWILAALSLEAAAIRPPLLDDHSRFSLCLRTVPMNGARPCSSSWSACLMLRPAGPDDDGQRFSRWGDTTGTRTALELWLMRLVSGWGTPGRIIRRRRVSWLLPSLKAETQRRSREGRTAARLHHWRTVYNLNARMRRWIWRYRARGKPSERQYSGNTPRPGIRRGRDGQESGYRRKAERERVSLSAGKAFRRTGRAEGDAGDGSYEVWWYSDEWG
jgi:hypothetical protein